MATPALTLTNLKGPIAKASGKPPAKSVAEIWAQINGLPPFVAPTPTPPPPAPLPTISEAQASRFLHQATMGATREQIAAVRAKGYAAWLDEQLALPRRTTMVKELIRRGEIELGSNSVSGYDDAAWTLLINEPDQVRHRVAHGLLDFLVFSQRGAGTLWIQFAGGSYLDILLDGALGNYRDILGKITLNPGMASYLSFINNFKADPARNNRPDENYAREFMQLFTLGLYELNPDGSLALKNGQPVPTYSQADVEGLARIFTGFTIADFDWTKYTYATLPLSLDSSINEAGPSTLLGKTFTGGGMAAFEGAIDHIFNRPSVGPFVGRQLIQRLVTSNPSAAYVGRVAAVFADNGKGVRGDLKAVVRTILLDPEARSDDGLKSDTFGRVRAPVLRVTAWARAMGATSPSGAWGLGNTSSAATGVGQSTGEAPSVFGFFRPGYVPPGGPTAAAGLCAPELQITNEQSTVGYVNYMAQMVDRGVGDVSARGELTDPVADANLLLTANQLSDASLKTIRAAVAAAPAEQKTKTAVLLTLVAPEFLVMR